MEKRVTEILDKHAKLSSIQLHFEGGYCKEIAKSLTLLEVEYIKLTESIIYENEEYKAYIAYWNGVIKEKKDNLINKL